MNTAMSTDPKKTPPATTVTKSQAYTLAKAQNLGGGKGFAAFVPSWPSWTDAPEGVDPGEHAAKLLDAAGADRLSASAAIDFIFSSRPSTAEGKAYRAVKGIALLLKQEVPAAPAALQNKPAQKDKPSAGPMEMAEIELAMAQVRLAEAKLRALRAR